MTGYTVRCNGGVVGQTAEQWLTLTSLTPASTSVCTVTVALAGNRTYTSTPVSLTTMPRPRLAPAPVNVTVSATATTIEVRWEVDVLGSVSAGLASFAVRRGSLVAATVGLQREEIPPRAAVVLRQLQPGTSYTIAVAAQNAYGSAPARSVSIATTAASCGGVVCGGPPSCGVGEAAVSVHYTNVTCCPLYVCQPSGCGTGCGSAGTCIGGRCVPAVGCPANCSVCVVGTPQCAACGGGLFLLGSACVAQCPTLGFATAQPGPNGTGGWCQPVVPCIFMTANGTSLTHPHNARWCDSPTRACWCELGNVRCATRSCADASPTTTAAPTPGGGAGSVGPVTPPPASPSPTMSSAPTLPPTRIGAGPTVGNTGFPTPGPVATQPPVHVAIDGGWGQWTTWSPCAAFGAVQRTQRTRSCSNPFPSHGGADCAGPSAQNTICDPATGHTTRPPTAPPTAPPLGVTTTATTRTMTGVTATPETSEEPLAVNLDATEGGASDSGVGIGIGVTVGVLCLSAIVGAVLHLRRRKESAALAAPPQRSIVTNLAVSPRVDSAGNGSTPTSFATTQQAHQPVTLASPVSPAPAAPDPPTHEVSVIGEAEC